MNVEDATAIMMANLKGSKNKPSSLLEFANACRTLLRDKEWGIKEMTRYFRVSEYMIRQIDKINELKSPKLKKLIKDGKLGIETCYQLSRIEEPKRSKVADIIQDMPANDVRRFVYFIMHNPKLSLTEINKLFENEKPEKIKLLVIPLDSQIHEGLEKLAIRSKLKIHDYALKVLREKVNGK